MDQPIVRALRWAREMGLNQSAFAARLGCSPQDITNWKKRGMPAEWYLPVANALSKSVDELLGHQTQPTLKSERDELVDAVAKAVQERDIPKHVRDSIQLLISSSPMKK